MVIKKDAEVPETILKEEGIKNVKRKILIGPADGSVNIIMRRFKVLHGGNTPFHHHDFEHVIKIEKGKGIILSQKGEETILSEGESLFIGRNENHQFKNPFPSSFEFLCIVVNPERNRKTKSNS